MIIDANKAAVRNRALTCVCKSANGLAMVNDYGVLMRDNQSLGERAMWLMRLGVEQRMTRAVVNFSISTVPAIFALELT